MRAAASSSADPPWPERWQPGQMQACTVDTAWPNGDINKCLRWYCYERRSARSPHDAHTAHCRRKPWRSYTSPRRLCVECRLQPVFHVGKGICKRFGTLNLPACHRRQRQPLEPTLSLHLPVTANAAHQYREPTSIVKTAIHTQPSLLVVSGLCSLQGDACSAHGQQLCSTVCYQTVQHPHTRDHNTAVCGQAGMQ